MVFAMAITSKQEISENLNFLYSTLLHLPPLKFHFVRGCCMGLNFLKRTGLGPETHTNRQATQHGCLPSLLGDGDKGIEIVYFEKKIFGRDWVN
jgi:hypothetical protein